MNILNFSELSEESEIKDALIIIDSGIEAVKPENFVCSSVKDDKIRLNKKSIKVSDYSNIFTVAFGKAADSMTKAFDENIRVRQGIVVLPKGTKSRVNSKKFTVIKSGHPQPDTSSVRAAKKTIEFLQQPKKDDLVVFLVSGGASALLCLPHDITLMEKKQTTSILLKAGVKIQELNCIRKHLSRIKGGRLVNHLRCDGIALVMSDVENDDLSSIASGCTYYDNTTFKDALAIIKKHGLVDKIPENVINHLKDGIQGKIPETPKKPKIPNKILASNKIAQKRMKEKAKEIGYITTGTNVFGDITKATERLFAKRPRKKRHCLVFGGETTVKVSGNGKGGRNQETVLRLLEMMTDKDHFVACSVGTDGIDGPTRYAGAITGKKAVDKKTIQRYLSNNDSYSFFKKYGGLVKTGPTHTNVMDIGVLLK